VECADGDWEMKRIELTGKSENEKPNDSGNAKGFSYYLSILIK
jgi:hypothetical protein